MCFLSLDDIVGFECFYYVCVVCVFMGVHFCVCIICVLLLMYVLCVSSLAVY